MKASVVFCANIAVKLEHSSFCSNCSSQIDVAGIIICSVYKYVALNVIGGCEVKCFLIYIS